MKREDFPPIQLAASNASANAQKRHLLFTKLKIALLLLTATVSAIIFPEEFRIYIGVIYVTILLAGVFISFFSSMRKYDNMWFNNRAVAESCKIEVWHFLMRIKPYDISDSKEAEQSFTNNLRKILDQWPTVKIEVAASVEGNQISEAMSEAREKPLIDRLNLYISERLQNQKLWYRSNSEQNRKKESQWFFIYWFLQFASVVVAIIVIYFRQSLISPVGILTTASASALSWINAKRYQELTQTYGLVANELTFLETDAKNVTTQEELEEIVRTTENTISREHTTWLIGRLGHAHP